MNDLTRRRLTDLALFAGLIAAWITHESGMLLHSLVSLVFTGALMMHVRNNWSVFQALIRRRTGGGGIDVAILLLMAVTIVTGLVFWATSGDHKLWHELVAIVATVALLAHFWNHRKSLVRLVRARPVASS